MTPKRTPKSSLHQRIPELPTPMQAASTLSPEQNHNHNPKGKPKHRQKHRHKHTRIARLLLAEYAELAGEPLLVESAFAETTRDGRGVREVALGLTGTKLLVATDAFRSGGEGGECSYWCPRGVDAGIETLELLSVYPLAFVTLSVFRRRRRKVLKARFCDGRAKYYELGGLAGRSAHWRMWCEQTRLLLERKCLGSSLSETTAAASSTGASTCYLLSSSFEYDSAASGRCRRRRKTSLWARCRGGAGNASAPTWPQKDLYLGPGYRQLQDASYAPRSTSLADGSLKEIKEELDDHSPRSLSKSIYKNSPSNPNTRYRRNDRHQQRSGEICDVIYARKNDRRGVDQRLLAIAIKENSSINDQTNSRHELLHYQPDDDLLSKEQCPSVVLDIEGPESDILTFTCTNRKTSKMSMSKRQIDDKHGGKVETRAGKLVRKISRFGFGVDEKCNSSLCLGPYKNYCSACPVLDPRELVERGVTVWENARKGRYQSTKKLHLRSYGISTATYFLHALGPWSVQPGDRESCQGRLQRSHSCVTVRRQPVDPELRLPVSRRQLAASVSLNDLSQGAAGLTASTRGRVVLFWTPDYWYRPRAATDAYREIRKHIGKLRQFRTEREKERATRRGPGIFRRKGFRRRSRVNVESYDVRNQSTDSSPASCVLTRIFSSRGPNHNQQPVKYRARSSPHGTTAHLRRLLRLDFRVSLWDLDSTTLARQLTLVDRELFLRVPCRRELSVMARQRASRDAPNLGAWIAFAHRIACLCASEVLAARKVDMRARLVARLINAAERCFEMGNFHSARSIVAGLQSPAVYRLRETWSHVKTHHATRYETMEKLCRVFRGTRTRRYRQAWSRAEAEPPVMPYVGDVLARLLGHYDDWQDDEEAAARRGTSSRRTSTKAAARKLQRKPAIRQKGGLRRWIFPTVVPRIKFRSPIRDVAPCWTDRERQLARRACDRWRSRVSDSKRQRDCSSPVDKVADWLERCQRQARQGYDFPGHSLAWEFLLKARYREDRDNFYASLELESVACAR